MRYAGGSYVVTTESQRARWQLPDLWTSGRARVVDESEAFGLLRAAPADPPPTRWDNGPNGPASEALRALAAPDPRLDQALEALERVDLPGGVCETLRRELRRTLPSRTVGKMVDRAQRALRPPWRQRSPARFDAPAVSQALERTHGGFGRVKARLVEVLAACLQSGGLLTVEGARDGRGVAATGAPLVLVVRPDAAGSSSPNAGEPVLYPGSSITASHLRSRRAARRAGSSTVLIGTAKPTPEFGRPVADGRVHADDLAADVQQRPAGVAGVDRRVGLQVGERCRPVLAPDGRCRRRQRVAWSSASVGVGRIRTEPVKSETRAQSWRNLIWRAEGVGSKAPHRRGPEQRGAATASSSSRV